MHSALLFGIAATALTGAAALSDRLYSISLKPRKSKAPRDPRTLPKPESNVRRLLAEGKRWLLDSSGCGQFSLAARDGLRLHAYFRQQPSHRWALCVHGYWDTAAGMGYWARHYDALGWSWLLPSLRGHGESQGTYVGMGWPDRLDLLAWIDWILARDPQAEIVLHGVSMGAAAVLMTTGEALPPNVKAAVSDCAFSSAYDQFGYIARHRMKLRLPFSVTMPVLRLTARLRAGYDLKEASALVQVGNSVTPTLFIHGGDDSFVPPSMLDILYVTASCPKARLLIPGADHLAAAPTDPDLYWSTVDRFLSPYLTGGTHT